METTSHGLGAGPRHMMHGTLGLKIQPFISCLLARKNCSEAKGGAEPSRLESGPSVGVVSHSSDRERG